MEPLECQAGPGVRSQLLLDQEAFNRGFKPKAKLEQTTERDRNPRGGVRNQRKIISSSAKERQTARSGQHGEAGHSEPMGRKRSINDVRTRVVNHGWVESTQRKQKRKLQKR